jgi:hypothetical protein
MRGKCYVSIKMDQIENVQSYRSLLDQAKLCMYIYFPEELSSIFFFIYSEYTFEKYDNFD